MFSSLLFNPSLVGRLILPGVIWKSATDKILLTFDDSPNPATTPELLKILNANNLRAVFFCIGRNAAQSPGLMQEIVAEEHLIANHSFSHTNMRKLNAPEQAVEILRCEEVLTKITGSKPALFRPPYGKLNRSLLRIARNCGYQTMLWSLLTYDYRNDKQLFEKSLPYLQANSIIVMHDHPKCVPVTIEGIRLLREKAYEKKLAFGRPAECLS